MAVPNTSTFTLQDVVDEINPVADSLRQCTVESLERKFDLNYCAIYPATKLSHFRNYGGFNTIQLSSSGSSTIAGGCGLTAGTNYYTDLRYVPTVGVTIYTNYPANVVLNGSNLYWKYGTLTVLKIGTDGIIDSTHDCSTSISMSYLGASTSSTACGYLDGYPRYISIGSTVSVGTTVYTTSALATVFNGSGNWFKYANSAVQIGTDGIIDTIVNCSNAIERSNTSYATAVLACANPMTSTTTVYYNGSLTNGTVIYTNIGLTTVFDGGGNGWKLGSSFSCEISAVGVISRENICF